MLTWNKEVWVILLAHFDYVFIDIIKIDAAFNGLFENFRLKFSRCRVRLVHLWAKTSVILKLFKRFKYSLQKQQLNTVSALASLCNCRSFITFLCCHMKLSVVITGCLCLWLVVHWSVAEVFWYVCSHFPVLSFKRTTLDSLHLSALSTTL